MVEMDAFCSPRGRASSYLRRACENCRRRKIKCDGIRPTCHPCRLRPPRTLKPCRYTYAPSHDVEQHYQSDDAIDPEESQSDMDTSRVYLSDPYPTENWPSREVDPPEATQNDLPSVPERPLSVESTMEEPSPYAAENLVDAFLNKFSEDGFFFLDPHEFRRSALLPVPFHHPARPSPGLLSAVYLWGTHILSNYGRPPVHEYTVEELLALTVVNLAYDVHVSGPLMHRREFLSQTIQSEVLLSLWYLQTGQPLYGRYHCATASALAAAYSISFPRSTSFDVPEGVVLERSGSRFPHPHEWSLEDTSEMLQHRLYQTLFKVIAFAWLPFWESEGYISGR
ncbi:Zn(2)-C6 fungal-type domain-containing protein [Mycena sanguinolenta]|uniref:Zn(2)-C6 fungal-type domain-containing protein n=1 Tax=Mycena sanguinolenta TaxID=230812 RepID=A0A8H6XJN9_9AGAR|nr:Zn(2)-C6 fungal-type domain-containing protein [Mycena sanguinolenta]